MGLTRNTREKGLSVKREVDMASGCYESEEELMTRIWIIHKQIMALFGFKEV